VGLFAVFVMVTVTEWIYLDCYSRFCSLLYCGDCRYPTYTAFMDSRTAFSFWCSPVSFEIFIVFC